MSRIVSISCVLALLALAGCGGGGDSSSSDSGSDSGASYDISVSEFIADTADVKTSILEDYVADNPSCNAKVDNGYLLVVSAAATNVSGDSELPKVIDSTC